MDTRPTLTLTLTAPLLLLLALTGCGNTASVADPPVSPAPTSSSAPPPKPETAEHFIRRWAKVEKQMENTGNSRTYSSLSLGCSACQKLASQIRSIYAAGGFVKWGGWKILSIHVNVSRGHATTYAVRNRSLPTTYRSAVGNPLQHLPGGVTTELLQVEPVGKTWNLASKAELAS